MGRSTKVTSSIQDKTTQKTSAKRKFGDSKNERFFWWVGMMFIPVIWQIYSLFSESPLIVGPIEVAIASIGMIQDGTLVAAAGESGMVFLTGILAGVSLGLLLGLLIGRFRIVDLALDPYLSAIYATPLVAIVPLLVVALGFGFSAKVVIVMIFAFFPVVINTAAGVRGVPVDLEELSKMYCSNELQSWRDIVLPSSLPFIITGIRLAVGRALIAVVVAEFSTAVTGLGYLILRKSRRFEMAESIVPVILLMITGFVLYNLLKKSEKKLAPWATEVRV
jgi:NitT/TauT family transport system permease protein